MKPISATHLSKCLLKKKGKVSVERKYLKANVKTFEGMSELVSLYVSLACSQETIFPGEENMGMSVNNTKI